MYKNSCQFLLPLSVMQIWARESLHTAPGCYHGITVPFELYNCSTFVYSSKALSSHRRSAYGNLPPQMVPPGAPDLAPCKADLKATTNCSRAYTRRRIQHVLRARQMANYADDDPNRIQTQRTRRNSLNRSTQSRPI